MEIEFSKVNFPNSTCVDLIEKKLKKSKNFDIPITVVVTIKRNFFYAVGKVILLVFIITKKNFGQFRYSNYYIVIGLMIVISFESYFYWL